MIAARQIVRQLIGACPLIFTFSAQALTLSPGDIIVADTPSKNTIRINPVNSVHIFI